MRNVDSLRSTLTDHFLCWRAWKTWRLSETQLLKLYLSLNHFEYKLKTEPLLFLNNIHLTSLSAIRSWISYFSTTCQKRLYRTLSRRRTHHHYIVMHCWMFKNVRILSFSHQSASMRVEIPWEICNACWKLFQILFIFLKWKLYLIWHVTVCWVCLQ